MGIAAAVAAAVVGGTHNLNTSPFGPRISVSGRSIVTVVVVTMPARALLAAFSRGGMMLVAALWSCACCLVVQARYVALYDAASIMGLMQGETGPGFEPLPTDRLAFLHRRGHAAHNCSCCWGAHHTHRPHESTQISTHKQASWGGQR
jgi:hypothetical protein